jgi:hypothetical protein
MVTLENTGLFWRQHKTQKTTHTDTTTNKMSCATLPFSGFAPSFSMGRAVTPPNHGTATPQCHVQAASHWGCARCHWFACLGRRNKRHQIIERGGCLGLRWPPFYQYKQQSNGRRCQCRVCVREEARPGWNVWGGQLPIIWGGILIDKKIERWEDPLP